MGVNNQLNRLAIHYVHRGSETLELAPKELDLTTLHSTIASFLAEIIADLWEAPDSGTTVSARFVADDHVELGPSLVKSCAGSVIREDGDFCGLTKQIARHLYQQSPAHASAGVLAVARFIQPIDGSVFVALLKIRHKDEDFIRVLSDTLTELEVEEVRKMLLRDVQKAAIIPHPKREDYDLKLTDKQTRDDPAIYFTANFLGCEAKKSDEHQIKKLLPELIQYAHKKKLSLSIERVPDVISELQDKGEVITTDVLSRVVDEKDIFGSGFQAADLKTYIDEESELGQLSVLPEPFAGRGKTYRNAREVTVRFTDPRYRGVTISGPPSIFREILETQGDSVTFRLETTRDGFEMKYE